MSAAIEALPSVSVVICCYSERRLPILVRAIESVQRQLTDADELVIVVDHAAALRNQIEAGFSRAKVVENRHRRGLSGARNAGVGESSGAVVAFLDDDAVPNPGWLQTLRSSYSDPRVIGVGGVVSPRWPATPPGWLPAAFLWIVGCSYEGLPRSAGPVRNPIGANMSFSREVFEVVGGFSESLGRVGTLPVGCEETEFSIRVGVAFPDRTILHQPAAEVEHHISAERVAFSYFLRRCWSEGMSKAVVSRLVEPSAALSSERSYITRTVLPGIVRQLAAAVRGERLALARAGALILGTGVTGTSYLLHSLRGSTTI